MTGHKYTPGPWKAYRTFFDNQPSRVIIHQGKWGGPAIADCVDWPEDGVTMANAHLAAEAPAMLDVLEEGFGHASLSSTLRWLAERADVDAREKWHDPGVTSAIGNWLRAKADAIDEVVRKAIGT